MNKTGNRFTNRTGEKYITNEGYEVEIIEYFSAKNITIQYEDGITVKNVFFSALKNGQVLKPYNRVGEIYISNEGQKAEIVEYDSSVNVTIKFEDDNVINGYKYHNLKTGHFKNPYLKNICEIGYLGEVADLNKDKVYNKLYTTWFNMMQRCYDEKELIKYPTYKDCFVIDDWLCFKNFYTWAIQNYNPYTMQKWHLDKDLLIKGNKIYSPETCCFVPNNVNTMFVKSNSIRGSLPIGVSKRLNKFGASIKRNNKRTRLGSYDTPEEAFHAYKTAKEAYIKEVADKWKDQIDPRVYQAMCNYKVEITD
jgi:hypothetical protein